MERESRFQGRLTPVALVDLSPDRTPADVRTAKGSAVVAQEGVRSLYEEDLVDHLFRRARTRLSGRTPPALLELSCGLTVPHYIFTFQNVPIQGWIGGLGPEL